MWKMIITDSLSENEMCLLWFPFLNNFAYLGVCKKKKKADHETACGFCPVGFFLSGWLCSQISAINLWVQCYYYWLELWPKKTHVVINQSYTLRNTMVKSYRNDKHTHSFIHQWERREILWVVSIMRRLLLG